MKTFFKVDDLEITDDRFFLIAGPCVIEDEGLTREIASEARKITSELGIPFIFKASFDKANRSSIASPRGPGIEKGLPILEKIKSGLNVPVLSDIQEPWPPASFRSSRSRLFSVARPTCCWPRPKPPCP
jgi:2-dehydro-3-deoxyphosphooctonate aldolase (KDO 8-P synthase)